ncbi:hypothetical protein M3Y99_01416600 [Aphelenchoides fujianensis]|nr:hypothetical protein M3Y99_01416600 [Aphelenchoides fujianensis]
MPTHGLHSLDSDSSDGFDVLNDDNESVATFRSDDTIRLAVFSDGGESAWSEEDGVSVCSQSEATDVEDHVGIFSRYGVADLRELDVNGQPRSEAEDGEPGVSFDGSKSPARSQAEADKPGVHALSTALSKKNLLLVTAAVGIFAALAFGALNYDQFPSRRNGELLQMQVDELQLKVHEYESLLDAQEREQKQLASERSLFGKCVSVRFLDLRRSSGKRNFFFCI